MEKVIGLRILSFPELPSTNQYLKEVSEKEKPQEGALVITLNQTQGRGFGQNQWHSQANKNLTFSFILYPKHIKATDQMMLNYFVSLAIVDFLDSLQIKASIKWPNDIYVYDKKISGILIENTIAGEFLHSSIIGIGLNIQEQTFPESLPNPISVFDIKHKNFDLNYCLTQLLENLNQRYFQTQFDKEKLKSSYTEKMYKILVESEFIREDKTQFEGVILGVDADGKLIVRNKNQEIELFGFKEIEYLIHP